MKITILGCGSSGGVPLIGPYWGDCNPNNKKNIRTRVSILLELAGQNILIDTSPDLRFQSITNKVKKIDAVCWTHAHADHAHGIDDLRQFLWKRKDKLPVYSNKETLDSLKKRFDYAFDKNNNYFQPSLDPHILKPGKFCLSNNIVGYNFNQYHGDETTLGYKFKNVVYSTDVKDFPYESKKYLKNLDLWILDCVRYEPHYSHAHFNLAIEWINEYKPKKTILTHLGAWLDYDELLSKCPNNVFPGYDGLVVEIT